MLCFEKADKMGTYPMTMIERKNYPELDKLLWDVHCETVTPDFAFSVYEDRWGFVEERNLSERERSLIKQLTQTIGHGIFTPEFG